MNAAKIALFLAVLAALTACAPRRHPAPVVDLNKPKPAPARPVAAAPALSPQSSDYYTVKRGDTLYSIALEHGADYREVAQWNALDDPTRIQVGQQLRVSPPQGEARVSSTQGEAQVGPARVVGRPESRPLEVSPLPPLPTAKPPPSPPPAAPPSMASPAPAVPQPAASQFMWPAKGRVLAEFAEPRRKGIDIDGKPGDPVVAAAAGRVTYIGTGIPGMGKLVVIKHDNGFITVYAHNRDILVKEQQAVARGQKIAEIGSTDSERPKLHFQIRRGAAAVDPLLYLPRS